MSLSEIEAALSILLIGGCIVASIALRWFLERSGLPVVMGFMVLGILLRFSDDQWKWLSDGTLTSMESLATLGIVSLMFRVGLESNLSGLLRELLQAIGIWIGNVGLSGVLGFAAAYWLLGMPLIPSLFIATALTATSVSIPLTLWRDAGLLQTRNGQLLLDVASLDDISAILLTALLIALAPDLSDGTTHVWSLVFTSAWLLLRLLGFAVVCILFARLLERRVTLFVKQLEPAPDAMLFVAGFGFMIAAFAGIMGFSVALGAFFAGLVFSRDPDAVKLDTPLEALHDLFAPFFFIHLGMLLDPAAFQAAWLAGLALALTAIAGKLIGTFIPARHSLSTRESMQLSVSMVPRAEIAMIVMHQGLTLGPWAVDNSIVAMIVVVSAITCLCAPLLLKRMLAGESQRQNATGRVSS